MEIFLEGLLYDDAKHFSWYEPVAARVHSSQVVLQIEYIKGFAFFDEHLTDLDGFVLVSDTAVTRRSLHNSMVERQSIFIYTSVPVNTNKINELKENKKNR